MSEHPVAEVEWVRVPRPRAGYASPTRLQQRRLTRDASSAVARLPSSLITFGTEDACHAEVRTASAREKLRELGRPLYRGRGLGVEALRDAPGEPRRVAGLDGAAHRRPPSRPGPRRGTPSSPAARRRSPSSIARAASEAVPIPASQITGTPAGSVMIRRL